MGHCHKNGLDSQAYGQLHFFFFKHHVGVQGSGKGLGDLSASVIPTLQSLPLGWLLFLHTYSLPDQKHELHSSRKKLYLKEV